MGNHTESSDGIGSPETRIQLARKGDRDALEALISRIVHTIRLRFENAISPSLQGLLTVDDLLQETFADAFLCIREFRGTTEQELIAWVSRMAENNLTDAARYFRAGKRDATRSISLNDLSKSLAESFCEIDAPDWRLAHSEALQILRRALEALPKAYRVVIERYDIQQIPMRQLAKQLQCSEGCLFMRRSRGIQLLQKIMGSDAKI